MTLVESQGGRRQTVLKDSRGRNKRGRARDVRELVEEEY
jgi:hypothetical protein